MTSLVSTVSLEAELASERLCLFDASWHLPANAGAGVDNPPRRDARREFVSSHLPGARFADLDALSDQAHALPHMLPSAEDFEASMRSLGLNRESRAVVYDSLGLFSAARLWWMLKVFGHEDVRVLDGGLPKWLGEGRAIESGDEEAPCGDWVARLDASLCASLEQVRAAELVLDARSGARFRGEAPEPRPGIASGHMPGARNLPFDQLLQPDGRLRRRQDLEETFAHLVSRQVSYVASAFAPWFVARRGPQAMAYPIAKERNAATGQGANALRELRWRAIALLQPLAMRPGIPCRLRRALTRRRSSDATYDA